MAERDLTERKRLASRMRTSACSQTIKSFQLERGDLNKNTEIGSPRFTSPRTASGT
jgi:hypothetical protein